MNIDDMVKIDLLNTILGRGMSSRLFTSLREQEKLCYHVSSYQSGKNNTGEIFDVTTKLSLYFGIEYIYIGNIYQ